MRVHLLLGTIVFAAACGGDSTPTPPVTTNKLWDVFTVGDQYSPTFLTLAVGDTARWNFAGGSDNMGHNVRFFPRITGSPADINVFKTGTISRVFTAKGTFNYVCDVHPGMQAAVIVQ